MTYYQQLKEKYPDDMKKAYKEYVLSKTIYRTYCCADNAPDFIKEAMSIQAKLNDYAEQLIKGSSVSLLDVLQIKISDFPKYYESKEDIFNFLELDRSSLLSHISGVYEASLKKATLNLKENQLEAIIIEEKNNTPILTEEKAQSKLKKIVETYGLSSVTYGKIRTTSEAFEKLENSLSQLKEVVECDSKQVGLRKFNIFLDISEFSYAGEASSYQNQIKLYLNERLSHDAFAHEWLHGMDMLMSEVKSKRFDMYSQSSKGKVHELLEGLKKGYEEDISNIKKTVLEDTKKYIEKIIERFDAMSSVNSPEILKQKLQDYIENIVKGNFNAEQIIDTVKSHMKEKNGCPSYVLTELSMLNVFLKGKDKDFKNSYFFEYAKEMEKSLKKTGLMDYEYSTLKEEMFARAFESFTQVRLKEKGLNNEIAHSNVSAWTPNAIETIRQKAIWEEVLVEIRDVMEAYLPTTKLIKNKSHVKNNIANIRKSLLCKEDSVDNKIAVKIK